MIFVFYGSTAAHIKETVHPERKILSPFTILSQRKFVFFVKLGKEMAGNFMEFILVKILKGNKN